MDVRFITDLSACRDIKSAADCLLGRALEVMQAPCGNVQVIDRAGEYLEIISQVGFEEEFLSCFRRVTITDPSACGRVLLNREQIVIEDVVVDSDYAPFREVAARADYRSVQSTPLQSNAGGIFGVVSTHWPRPRRPSDDQLNTLRMMAGLTANTIVRLTARNRLKQPA